MQSLLVNQSPVSSITYSNKMRVIYDGVEQDAELRKYPSGKIYFRTENAHFVPVNEVGVLIPLTKGKSAIVDFEDYEHTIRYRWRYAKGYAVRSKYRTEPNRHWANIYMHREIMNVPNGMHTDHIDRNKLNNRRNNLRICTNAENCCNQGIQRNNTSGYKGVTWHKRQKKWHAQITVNGKNRSIGYFADKIEAACAYNVCAKEHFGEFAYLNEINPIQ